MVTLLLHTPKTQWNCLILAWCIRLPQSYGKAVNIKVKSSQVLETHLCFSASVSGFSPAEGAIECPVPVDIWQSSWFCKSPCQNVNTKGKNKITSILSHKSLFNLHLKWLLFLFTVYAMFIHVNRAIKCSVPFYLSYTWPANRSGCYC